MRESLLLFYSSETLSLLLLPLSRASLCATCNCYCAIRTLSLFFICRHLLEPSIMQMASAVKEWFSEAGYAVIHCGKIAASVVAMATVVYPLSATYFKVEHLEEQDERTVCADHCQAGRPR